MGVAKTKAADQFELTDKISGNPEQLMINSSADALIVRNDSGQVFYFRIDEDGGELIQTFSPFQDLEDRAIASMNFIFGDVSILFSNKAGQARIFSIFPPDDKTPRLFGHTRTPLDFEGGIDFYAASTRNKSYIAGSGSKITLRQATTNKIRWEKELDFTPSWPS